MPALERISKLPDVIFGADPEFFFEREGSIIGAERVMKGDVGGEPETEGSLFSSMRTGKLVLDGVQVELHPYPSSCRAGLCLGIAAGFRALKKHLESVEYKGVKASFRAVVEVPKEEFEALSRSSRELGCKPSFNVRGTGHSILKSIDSQTYRTRSAGGHIHLGLPGGSLGHTVPFTDFSKQSPIKPDYAHYPPERLVRLLDIIVGNTCVLLDRDPGQIERRRVYGLAGEYRTPPYGVEYRTLSNFWLRACPLASLVTGLSRLAAAIIYSNGSYSLDHDASLLSVVDYDKVTTAINSNDATLARSQWEIIKQWISTNVQDSYSYIGENPITLAPSILEDFEYFVSRGIDHWFKEDPVEHWCRIKDAHGKGFESFLMTVVREEMRNGTRS